MKKFPLAITTFLIVGVLGFFLMIRKSSVISLPITFTENHLPVVQANIEGHDYPLLLSLTSKYPLALKKEILNSLEKKSCGEGSWKNVKGEQFVAPLFELPKIKLRDLKLKRVLTSEKSMEGDRSYFGGIVWPFEQWNLLLDFPRHNMYGVRYKNNLKDLGIDLAKMQRIPCEFNHKGIFFNLETSLGLLRVSLVSSCNYNIINNLRIKKESSEGDVFHVDFKTGIEKKLNETFVSFGIPEVDVDAILGVDFLKKHIVYIDASNRCIYIGEKTANALSRYAVDKVPIEFTQSNIPVVGIKIGKKRIKAIVDLGSCMEFKLPEEFFELNRFQYLFKSTSINGCGEEEQINSYFFPEYQIGKVTVRNCHVHSIRSSKANLKLNVESIGTLEKEKLAYLGNPLLYRTNIYFDCEKGFMSLIYEEKNLSKINIDLENYIKIPFEWGESGIELKVEVSSSTLCFLLDTGASVSLIKKDLAPVKALINDPRGNICLKTDQFIMSGTDFGSQYLYPFDLSEKIEGIDAVLGMDFLYKHPFYIDFKNRLIYFKTDLTCPP